MATYIDIIIKNELQYFKDNGIRLKVIDLPTTMMDLPEGQEWVFEMVNNILIEVLGTIAEQERATIKKRQAEGIEAAKQKGKKLGRPALVFPDNWNAVYASWRAGEITAKAAMEHGLKSVEVYVKGPGSGREAAIRALQTVGLEVRMIKDVTPIPHNGCRPPKRRRV